MKYFTYNEFIRSNTAKARKIDNTPTDEQRKCLKALVDNVLDPLRESWGHPIVITSGYRSQTLNKIVGGSNTSHHMRGMAADITAGSRENNRKLFELIKRLKLPFTQLIDEHSYQWIHISYDASDIRMQELHLK